MNRPQVLSLDGDDWTLYWLLPHEWEWRKVWERDPPEAASRRIPALVPGHVQDALLRAGGLPDWRVGTNSRLWEWVSERDWVYRKEFLAPTELAGLDLHLHFEGIDDSAVVFLNGRRVGAHTGQFQTAEWNVTDWVRPGASNELIVIVRKAPEVQGQTGRTSQERRWKSRFAYGWDWCTRLVPLGLWDSVSLVATGGARFGNISIYTNVANDRTEAAVSIVCEFAARQPTPATIFTEITQGGLPVASIADPITVFGSDTSLVQSATLKRVQLWWPNGAGHPSLYQAALSLVDENDNLLDQKVVEFGVRQVDAVACEGAPPDSLPYSLSVNGRRVWIKGWNWVPLDHLYGGVPAERYEQFLRLARAAHVNMLRVWGGGLLEKEIFYRLCDRYGIMVWQEFPLSSSGLDNTPPGDPVYLDYIRDHAEGMIPRRRHHASLVLWCGGNELTNEEGEPLGSEHPALAELRAAVEIDHPQSLWLPTSPTGPRFSADPDYRGELHDVHGPWQWLGLRRHPEFYNRIDPLLHSEFGCAGAANPETLAAILPAGVTLPRLEDPTWAAHGGNRWLRPEEVQAAFGDCSNVQTFVRASQQLQAMGLQYAVEANRRRKWRCAGTLPWQFNEAWPNAVCTNAVDYYGRPKPAYYAVKRAYAPFHVSAGFATFDWAEEKEFRADIWLHNSGDERSLLNVVATVTDLQGRELYQENLAAEAPENSAENVGDLAWRFPDRFTEAFLLFLEVIDEEGDTLARNAYFHSRAEAPAFSPFLSAPGTTLEVSPAEDGICVRNTGKAVALGIRIDAGDALVEDSDFPLRPGTERRIRLSDREAKVVLSAWNGNHGEQ